MRDEVSEYILCAAVWYKELELKKPEVLENKGFRGFNINKGIIFCGVRHAHCIYQKVAITGLSDSESGDFVQGFLTSRNRFLNREDAMKLALERNQVDNQKVSNILFSEDLY